MPSHEPSPAGRPQPQDEEARPTRDRRSRARRLPHERDEAPDPAGSEVPAPAGPRDLTGQAARDIARGLRDTDRHGTPSDVPGPGPEPERSPGADVPPEGVRPDK